MYKIGDKIVYPMHGAGVIEDIEKMDIFDKVQTYYKVTIASEGMEILIPVDKADEVGLRDIPTHEDIQKMFEVLKQPQDKMTSNWSKRYQDNMDQMKTGDILDVARVTRNLMILDRKKGLSSGDKKMLMTAKNFLISELMVVENEDKRKADDAIEDAVQA
ncbi:CarD family transcriptional regulator [Pseudoramibacter sp.]|jgi:CarD family transcriptional regulator|uniref:CarD family transcriptional regulator n=1 Tax=Pseudoramibacter sp. TaxID=2034862 RepID=UPI0025F06949|nr:CarD family transcriptional regulator [Pseudoramibacter sp.]MCH4071476.1 CarD family transcriptional regulator [Pseudoramibacter sp.]MCH4105244.1 CarD family transcriptional regulator [Pseudoramibacter sp.]